MKSIQAVDFGVKRKKSMVAVMSLAGGALAFQPSHAADVRAPGEGETVSTDWRDLFALSERIQSALNDPLDSDWTAPSTSSVLAEFFKKATVESVEPFLYHDQLLQHAARYANDPDIIAFLIESGFDPNEAFGFGIAAYPQDEDRFGERGRSTIRPNTTRTHALSRHSSRAVPMSTLLAGCIWTRLCTTQPGITIRPSCRP